MIAGEPRPGPEKPILVLSSQRAFEALVGPVPEATRARWIFRKPDRGSRVLDALSQARLAISQSYLRPEVNRWIFEARRRGVPTLLLIDGPLEWANLHANPSLFRPGAEAARALYDPIFHDAVATIGENQARFIASRNRGRGIRFLSYSNHRIRTAAPSGAQGPRFDFLLTTARTAAFDEAERKALTHALRDCLAALDRAGHRTLVRLFDDEIRSALQSTATRAHFDTTGSFTDALAETRCVIGTPSSVLLEAMHHDRPTATLVFRDGPLLDGTGWLLGGFADWETSFASMLAADPARMSLQREALRASLSERDFYAQLDESLHGDTLAAPRAFDALDLEFENRVLRQLAGWRARLLAPLYRALRSPDRSERPPRP